MFLPRLNQFGLVLAFEPFVVLLSNKWILKRPTQPEQSTRNRKRVVPPEAYHWRTVDVTSSFCQPMRDTWTLLLVLNFKCGLNSYVREIKDLNFGANISAKWLTEVDSAIWNTHNRKKWCNVLRWPMPFNRCFLFKMCENTMPFLFFTSSSIFIQINARRTRTFKWCSPINGREWAFFAVVVDWETKVDFITVFPEIGFSLDNQNTGLFRPFSNWNWNSLCQKKIQIHRDWHF